MQRLLTILCWLLAAGLPVLASVPAFADPVATTASLSATPAAATLRLGSQATQVDPSSYAEYLEDTDGTLSYDHVARQGKFRPLPGGRHANFGYTSSTIWLRIPFTLLPGAPSNWLLEVGHFSLDYIAIFAPNASPQVSGKLLPFSARPVAHRHFVFPLTLTRSTQPDYLYVQVKSTGTLSIPLRLWQPNAFIADSERSYAVLALYYGALLALLLYNLMLYFSLRDQNYLIYALFVASNGLAQLSINGLGYQFLWTEPTSWTGVTTEVAICLAGLTGSWFIRRFLDTARTMPFMDLVSRALMAMFALFIVLVISAAVFSKDPGRSHYAGPAAAFAVVACFLGLFSGALALYRGHTAARFFAGAWLALLLGGVLYALRSLGILPHNLVTAHGAQIGSLLEMLLLSFALADRIHTERREREKAQMEAFDAKQALVETLTESERNLEARVAARTEELEQKQQELLHNQAVIWEMKKQNMLAEERERIMRDMHDGVGGYLVATLAQLESGKACAKGHVCPPNVTDSLRRALDDLRLMIDSLDPVEEDLLAVLGMLRARLGDRLKRAGIDLKWRVTDLPPIPDMGPHKVLQVMRILQEAISNVVKHAQAQAITVATGSLQQLGVAGVYVDVVDDGVGFKDHEGTGRGVGNMRYRARSIGAQLAIEPAVRGTCVRLWLPLVADAVTS